MKQFKAHVIATLAMSFAVSMLPNLSGCDKTKSEHETEVTHPDGTTETAKQKTVEKPNGAIETKTEHTTSSPAQ